MRVLTLITLLILLGLTFVYNPKTGTGIVFYNQASFHGIIMVDTSSGQLTFYRAVNIGEQELSEGLTDFILRNYGKNIDIKSVISPSQKQNVY